MVASKEMRARACEICGKDIPSSRRTTAATCSPECAKKRKLAYYKSRAQTDSFKASERERKAAQRDACPANSNRTVGRIVCVECGGPLPVGAAPNRKTCSEECRREHRRKYIRQWHNDVRADDEKREALQARARRNDLRVRGRRRLTEVKDFIDDRSR